MKKVSILLVLIVLAASSAEAVTAQGGSDSVDREYIALSVEGAHGANGEKKEGINANEILEPALQFVGTHVAGNRLSYRFNGGERNLGLWQLYVADYDIHHYSQRMVEESLDVLGSGKKPEWAREEADLSIKWKNGDLGLQAPSLGMGNRLVGNARGVLYYAAQIRDNTEGMDNPSYYWVRGKLDYRKCAYSSKNLPHIANNCQVRMDETTGEYVFEQRAGVERDENDPYENWAEELTAESYMFLEQMRGRIRDWEGDADEKEWLLWDLQGMKNAAEDASDQEGILVKVAEYEELLREKAMFYEPEEKNPELENGDGSDNESDINDKDENGGGAEQPDGNTGVGGDSSSIGATKPDSNGVNAGEQVEVNDNVMSKKPVGVVGDLGLGDMAGNEKNASEGNFEALEGESGNDVRLDNEVLQGVGNSLTGVELPKLSETNGGREGLAIVGGLFAMIAGFLGWKRWSKRRA